MKRILALLLAMIMICTLAACGNNTADNTDRGTTTNTESSTTGTEGTTESTKQPDETTSATDGTEESTSATEGTQAPTEDTKPTEKPTEQTKPTEKPTEQTQPTEPTKPTGKPTEQTKPTEPTKPTEDTKPTEKPTEQTKPTVPTKPTEPTPTQPKPTEPKPTKPVKENKYVSFTVEGTGVTNQKLLTRMFGKDKAFQIGDTVKIKINMSSEEVKKEDISIIDYYGCTCSVGNGYITATFEGGSKKASVYFSVKNSDGTIEKDELYVSVVQTENLANDMLELKYQFQTYGRNKGMRYINDGWDFMTKYNGGYTYGTDDSGSITGYVHPNADDLIAITSGDDWIYDVLDLLDEYGRRGFTRFSFQLISAFQSVAE